MCSVSGKERCESLAVVTLSQFWMNGAFRRDSATAVAQARKVTPLHLGLHSPSVLILTLRTNERCAVVGFHEENRLVRPFLTYQQLPNAAGVSLAPGINQVRMQLITHHHAETLPPLKTINCRLDTNIPRGKSTISSTRIRQEPETLFCAARSLIVPGKIVQKT